MKVLGHETIRHMLKRAVDNRSLHHALLFHGLDGVGKRLAAVRLAQYRACPERGEKGVDCGGGCASCSRMERGLHPDLIQLCPGSTGAGTIKIDEIRELIRQTRFKPFEASSRCFIIDGADSMTPEAANSLLKTLEEPPPELLIILITSRPEALLPTIRSRCQWLRFRPFPAGRLEELLTGEFGIDREEARLRSRLAEGSLGRALSMELDTFREKRNLAMEIMRCLGEPGWQSRQQLLTIAAAVAQTKKQWDRLGKEIPGILGGLIRDLILLQNGGDPSQMTHVDMREELAELGGMVKTVEPYQAYKCLAEVETGLRRNLNRRLICEILFMQLSRAFGAAGRDRMA